MIHSSLWSFVRSAYDALIQWLAWLWQASKQKHIRDDQSLLAIHSIFIYPVKSCGGISVQSAKLVATGLQYDRNWVIVDKESKKFVTQRQLPQMVLIKPRIVDNELQLTRPDTDKVLSIPLLCNDQPGESLAVQVWDEWIGGMDEGDKAAEWLSEYLGQNVRLIRKDPSARRPLNGKYVDDQNDPSYQYPTQTAFADGYPLLITSDASIKDISDRLRSIDSQFNIGVRNFRPNILIQGASRPFEEDDWPEISIIHDGESGDGDGNGDPVRIRLVKKCSRCTMPNVDPDKGQMLLPTLKTLMKYRRIDPIKKYEAFLGVNGVHLATGSWISVGQVVEI